MNFWAVPSKDGYTDSVFLDLEEEKRKLASILPISKNARTVFDLSEEERLTIDRRMRPEGRSEEGFLKCTDRLLPVCIQDANTLLEKQVPCHLIADILSSIIAVAQQSDNPAPIVWDKFKVEEADRATAGYQTCPFAKSEEDFCHFGRRNRVITNITNGISIPANNLTIGMARDHCFFQTGPYRLDPEKAIECLELRTTEYKMHTENIAVCLGLERIDNKRDIQRYKAEKIAVQKYAPFFAVASAVTGCILPFKDRHAYEDRGWTVEQRIRKEAASKGLPEEEIQSQLQDYAQIGLWFDPPATRAEMLSQIIERKERDGDQFLHVFNDKELEDEQIIREINGFKLLTPIQAPGIYIFELGTQTRALAPDSAVSGKGDDIPRKKRKVVSFGFSSP